MEWKEILSHVDHTLLKPEATWEDIRQVVEEGIHYGCASVCIPPAYVQRAAEYAAGRVAICTVIGFPNGYNAAPIDMVVNLGWVKDGLFGQVLAEIQAVKAACQGRVLKVIIETCLLTQEEKCRLCQVVSDAGADYIKTSTGFSTGGATEAFLALGADRLGTSRLVKLAKEAGL